MARKIWDKLLNKSTEFQVFLFKKKTYLKIEFLGQIAIRTRIINELVSSEFTYLTLLRDISKFWIEPLSKILSKQDMKTIFINLTKIKEIHESFYEDVKKESEKQFESRKISGKHIFNSCGESDQLIVHLNVA